MLPAAVVPLPYSDKPHTQLGLKGKGKYSYKQAREWGYDADGKLIPKRDIDFTDHGRPSEHPNPHQHTYYQNPAGGGIQRLAPEPFKMSEPENIHNFYRNKG